MCKRNIIKSKLIIFPLIISSSLNCITAPRNPKIETPECISNFYHNRRAVKEIQDENRKFTLMMIGASFPIAYFFGPAGLIPLAVLPYSQYTNFKKASEIITRYEENHCKEKNDE